MMRGVSMKEWLVLPALLAAAMLTCATEMATNAVSTNVPPQNPDLLQKGDTIKITLSGPRDLEGQPPIQQTIKEDGTITLELIGSIVAAGKKKGDLEKEIHSKYVPKYYKHLTVVVTPDSRFYFVDGYVKNPSRQVYLGETTVLKAIASAGGFTDYAKKSKVKVTRASGETFIIDCEKALKNPQLDKPIYPGDKIYVPMRVF